MNLRKHLTYANVAATLALVGVVGGGGAYAAGLIDSGDVENNALRSKDLKNRKAVKAEDVRRDGLTGQEVRERTIDASAFAPVAGRSAAGACDPEIGSPTTCVQDSVVLPRRGRLIVLATGNFFAEEADASLDCEITVDGDPVPGPDPGQEAAATSPDATDGFATTHVTSRLSRGEHAVALRCTQAEGDTGAVASASIAVLGIGEGR